MKFSYESQRIPRKSNMPELGATSKTRRKKMLGILYVKDITGLLAMSKTILPRLVTTGAVRESY